MNIKVNTLYLVLLMSLIWGSTVAQNIENDVVQTDRQYLNRMNTSTVFEENSISTPSLMNQNDRWTSLGMISGNWFDAIESVGDIVYGAGIINAIDGSAVHNIASYNSTTGTWSTLGSGATHGVDNWVQDIAIDAGYLVAGGFFANAGGLSAPGAAIYDIANDNWIAMGTGLSGVVNSMSPHARAVAISDSLIIVGGNFAGAGGISLSNIARYNLDTNTWSALSSTNNPISSSYIVEAIEIKGDLVYIGGTGGFHIYNHQTDTWVTSSSAVSGRVQASELVGSTLYLGGNFTSVNGQNTGYMAKYDIQTETFSTIGNSSAFSSGLGGPYIASLSVINNLIYAVGDFSNAGDADGDYVVGFDMDSETYFSLGSGINSRSFSSEIVNNALYVGGSFSQAGGNSIGRLAAWDLSPDLIPDISISQIYPEAAPTGSEMHIYGVGFSTTTSDQTVEIGGIKATITDALDGRLTVEVPELNPGMHNVSVTKDGVTDELNNAFQWLFASAPNFSNEDFLFAMNDIININSGDFNNDGDIDLVMNSGALNDVDIRYNNQNFQFTSRTNIHATFENHDVHPVDIDDDGDLDVIASLITQNTPGNSTDDRIVWFRNNGPESNPTYTELAISTSVNGARDIFAADLDGDGDKDVISSSFVSGVITWHQNDEGAFNNSFDVTDNAAGVSGVHAADLNNDGLMDVLSAGNQTVSWYPNEGNGVFTQKIDIINGESNVGEVIAADFDNDGHLDIVTNGLNSVLWFRNNGTADFSDRRTIDASINEPVDFLPADLDGDGDQDLIVVSENNGSPKWYQNLGTGRFSSANELPATINRAFGIDAADYDNDGDVDIIVAQRFASDVPGAYLYENTSIVNEPYAYFPFNGDNSDAGSNAFAVNTVGNPILDRDAGGALDSAYYFDGSDDYFETQASEPFEFQSFSFSMWLNAYSLPPQGKASVFLAKQPGNVQTGYYTYLYPDGGIFTSIYDSNGANTRRTAYTVNIGEWTHFAVTYDGSVLQTYVNGMPEAAQQFDAEIVYDNSPLTIGGYYHPTNSFDGKMDEVRIYDVALSPGEIAGIYQAEKPTEFDNTSDWSALISTNANGKNSTAEFGTTPISTDGFDASLDIPLPPAPTGDYLQLYFAHPEFGGTLGDKYRSDYKGYSDYESSNSNWKLSLYSTFAANDTLFITRPNGFTAPIKVIDSQGMEYISLSGDLEVLYSIQAGETLVFDIVVGDIFPPIIELGAIMDGPQIWDKTQSRTLTWTVDDPSGITNITTEVSYDGGSTWQAIYTGLDQSFNFTPDANIVLNEATFFRVSATDGASQEFTNSTTVASDHEITIAAPSQSLDYSTGWQMVGSPFADSIEPTSVLSDAIRYRWNTESFEYVLSNTYPNKEGIWLGGYSNGSDQLDGEVGETDATFTVYGGWNMVTVPLFRNVQVDSISVFDGTTTRTFSDAVSNFDITVPQGYNGAGYTTAESLEFFKSYWIGVTGDSLKLTLPIHRFNPVLKQSQIMEEDEILLTIVDGEFEQQLLIRVGGNPSQPAPPPAPNAHKIGLKGESTILGNTYTQYSLSSSEQEGAEIPLVIEGPERLLTMKWQKTGFESVPILLKAMENHTLDSPNGSIEISSTELSSAILAIGNFAVSNEVNRGVPVAFKLNQNYPNPFNPSTTIGFDLPEKAVVQIDVFNVTGQKVTTIVNSTLQPGSHTVQFDASELSSGTYIYRIQAGSFSETRKMILIK
jgi:hypothetical protein